MKIKVMAIQPGTVKNGMSNEEYFNSQIEFLEKKLQETDKKPDIVMFPELMTGMYFGFVREKRWFAGAEDFLEGPTTKKMLELSKKYGIQIQYTLFEKSGEDYYNTMGLVSPIRGVIGKYRKTHIPGGDLRYNECYENYYFKEGNELPVFELDNGVKFGMMLCYDRSFPELWRAFYLKGVQLISVATCTMGLRKDMFVTELRTRALESHSFVVATNRAGEEKTENEPKPRIHFGKSLIANPLGDIVCSLEDEAFAVLEAELDMDETVYARGRLNWARDRRPDLYGIVADENLRTDVIYDKGF